MSEIVEQKQMEYNLGGNTILWFSMVLLDVYKRQGKAGAKGIDEYLKNK